MKPRQPIKQKLTAICKNPDCGIEFKKQNSFQKYHCQACLFAVEGFPEPKQNKLSNPIMRKPIAKVSLTNKKIIKEKTLGQCEIEAKEAFQKFIRLRDKKTTCISCNKFAVLQAGHFFKCELYSGLIFNELNCNGQCENCNIFLDGNFEKYEIGLRSRFGNELVNELNSIANKSRVYKYSKGELIAMKEKYLVKIKSLSK